MKEFKDISMELHTGTQFDIKNEGSETQGFSSSDDTDAADEDSTDCNRPTSKSTLKFTLELNLSVCPENNESSQESSSESDSAVKEKRPLQKELRRRKTRPLHNQLRVLRTDFGCKVCEATGNIKFFNSQRILLRHLTATHKIELELQGPQKCEFCVRIYKTKASYLKHVMKSHPKLQEKMKTELMDRIRQNVDRLMAERARSVRLELGLSPWPNGIEQQKPRLLPSFNHLWPLTPLYKRMFAARMEGLYKRYDFKQ